MKMKSQAFVVILFITTYAINGEVLFNTGVDENTYDWGIFSNEFTTFDDIELEMKGKTADGYFVMNLLFHQQNISDNGIAFRHIHEYKFKTLKFSNGRVGYKERDNLRVWFVVHNTRNFNQVLATWTIAKIES